MTIKDRIEVMKVSIRAEEEIIGKSRDRLRDLRDDLDAPIDSVVYVVTMYRWGDREQHSYLAGVFLTETEAKEAAETEQECRGGNFYYPEVLEVPFGYRRGYEYRVVVPLKKRF